MTTLVTPADNVPSTEGGTPPIPPLVTASELARLIPRQPRTLRQWAAEGRIPSVRIGGNVFFVVSEVITAIRAKSSRQ